MGLSFFFCCAAGVIVVNHIIKFNLENITIQLAFLSFNTVPAANIHWYFNENSDWIGNMTQENLFTQRCLACWGHKETY